MTTIKPPADPSAAGPGAVDAATSSGAQPDAPDAARAVDATDAADFQAMVASTGAPGATAPAPEAGVAALAPDLSPLVKGLQDGSLTVDGAVELLLERALGDTGAVLDPGARAELETLLRGAIESDPTLIALRDAASES